MFYNEIIINGSAGIWRTHSVRPAMLSRNGMTIVIKSFNHGQDIGILIIQLFELINYHNFFELYFISFNGKFQMQ